ncbi:MAG TPA: hypothetical protein VGE37_02425 [Archangium sp.]
MKRLTFLTLTLAALACTPPPMDPTVLEREVPAQGDPPRGQPVPYAEDAGTFAFPDAGCCAVRFAVASRGEAAVSLFGFAPPLRPSVAMGQDGGVWEAVVCMPRSTQLYGYQRFTRLDDGDAGEPVLFESYAHNPNAPVTMSLEYGLLNEFQADDAGTCGELDVAPHADVSVPDAGP